jgi:hypothetical protein
VRVRAGGGRLGGGLRGAWGRLRGYVAEEELRRRSGIFPKFGVKLFAEVKTSS